MRYLSPVFAAFLLVGMIGSASAQSIDAGRGELPVYVPTAYDGDAATPLIVLLHGYTSSGEGQNGYFGLSALVDRYGFIMVAPDGTRETGGDKQRFWNASTPCCDLFDSKVDDSAYIATLIDRVKSAYTVDDKRVYLIGHSNGGFMSYRMAHDRSGTIAAIASLAGLDQTDRPSPPDPLHVSQIHGTADAAVAYEAGEFLGAESSGARKSVEQWAAYNGCDAAGQDSGTLDLDAGLAGAETDVTRYTSGCRAGGSAELWSINDGGHVPALSEHFMGLVVEWLMGHPKP